MDSIIKRQGPGALRPSQLPYTGTNWLPLSGRLVLLDGRFPEVK